MSLVIHLDAERSQQLATLASERAVTSEQLINEVIDEYLRRRSEEFSRAASYVLEKNADLYHRLAQ